MALPEPEAGLVVSYAYLWSQEQRAGKTEGLKNRPCAIVLVVTSEEGHQKVTVAPITHTQPNNPGERNPGRRYCWKRNGSSPRGWGTL
jgi:hypothetical protein